MGSLSLRPGDSLTIPRMALSVGFIRFVSSANATQATGFRLLPRWDCLPLNMPAFAGHTMAQKRKPGRPSRAWFRPVVNAQDAANNILVDGDAESQRDLLSNAGTAPVGIAPFHCYDGVDEVFLRSLRARAPSALGRKQPAVFSFPQHTVQMQQSGRLQNDG